MAKLELENIFYRYKGADKDVLKDINCTFEGGKLNAIVGPSGSGKTTLLSIMAGLDEPTQGKISINGNDLKDMDLDEYRRDNVSMIFQAFQLFPLLTALENVSFPMEYKGILKEEAREKGKTVLDSLGIDGDKLSRYPSNLSGGEQQRVAIGRTLATGAKVILADEPTGNLDDENSERIIDILKELAHQQDFCVIIVTHDMEIAEESDHVWRIKDGTIEQVK
ncbi:ABC transporter ATP-binding protein [Tissierella carlieri]|jgi:ABC-type lipoprotein export system ATPase subunit|uniref:ABC transporter ATP-binding protein n=1 Tax=Tissierella carlieri TaxID=689904 RepID=UPI001C0FA58A|nr:ABC transporter ATP-binding protein [Tissierella carlieri]MBU5311416.1 ABC transporter ATP-binding protein [Tissierella carlieri]